MQSTPLQTFLKLEPFEKRCAESAKIIAKYPDRIPVICVRAPFSTLPDMERKKFLVPGTMLCYEFKYTIVTNIAKQREADGSNPEEQVIYLLVDNKVAKTGAPMADIYEAYKSEDGFLYMTYTSENTLGAP
mmetsp:Transcript_50957/g.81334  ORF Transcript_50957/g.81334 Transcript_50957/m.81334 type:complete len:131 (+) Transcript_50957:99-491(+)